MGVQRNITEGLLQNDISRFIGFGEGTAVIKPVSPGETLDIELTRVAMRGDREIYKLRATSQADGQLKVVGTVEMRPSVEYTAVFPGNASQKVGMARKIYEAGGVGRQVLEQGAAASRNPELLLDIITDGASIPEGNAERRTAFETAKGNGWLNRVDNSSPAVITTSHAYFADARSKGFLEPSRTSGHSLGQIEAAVAAGAMEFEDGVRFSEFRADILREFAPGKIAAVIASAEVTPQMIAADLDAIRQEGEVLGIANENKVTGDDSQIGISGHRQAIERAKSTLEAKGYRVVILPGDIAFHSTMLDAAKPRLREALSRYGIRDPRVPVASIVTPGKLLRTAAEILDELVDSIPEAVHWDGNVRSFAEQGPVVEFGAGTVLTDFNKKIAPDQLTSSVSKVGSLHETLYRAEEVAEAAPPATPSVPIPEAPSPTPSNTTPAKVSKPAVFGVNFPSCTKSTKVLPAIFSAAKISL